MNERNIIFLSELGHIDMLDVFLGEHASIREEGFILIPLDLEIEYALKEKGISFRSGRAYRTGDAAPMTFSESWTSSVFESKRWSFFAYRDVSLSQLYFLSLQWYLSRIIYYADVVSNVLIAHAEAVRFIVFSPLIGEAVMGGTLDGGPRIWALVDVLKCIAAQSGREAVVVPVPTSFAAEASPVSFMFMRSLFGIGIGILNAFITLFRRPQRIRVLASDYWSNLAPYVSNLNSLEIVLIDRKEALKAKFSNIWKFRMRFLHIDSFPANASLERIEVGDRIKAEFESIKNNGELPAFEFRGFSLQPLVSHALDIIVKKVLIKTLGDIDDAYIMFEHVRPQIVLLRATSSLQTHFIILAQVARALGVPSLEVQHGLQYYGPGSYTRRYSTEYMGVYGTLTQREMKEVVGAHCTPVVVGSPRFDVYASVLKNKSSASFKSSDKKASFLFIAPSNDSTGEVADSYSFEEYLSAVAFALKKIPDSTITIKLRPGGTSRDSFSRQMIADTFRSTRYTIVQNEPIMELYNDADVVISYYSTAVVEAIQCGKPLVLLALGPMEILRSLHHFSAYVQDKAIRMATTKEDLARIVEDLAEHPAARAELASQGTAFLEREYSFDGHASERMAALILSLVEAKDRVGEDKK